MHFNVDQCRAGGAVVGNAGGGDRESPMNGIQRDGRAIEPAVHVVETRESLLAKAQEAMRLAESEPLPNRARIHVQAAETWLRLAARKVKREEAPIPPPPAAIA